MSNHDSAKRQSSRLQIEQLEARQLMAINVVGPIPYVGASDSDSDHFGNGGGGAVPRPTATELKAAFTWEMEKRFTDAGGIALLRNNKEFVDPGTFEVDFNGRLSEIPPEMSPATYAWEIVANGQVRQRGNGHSLTANLEEGSYYASLKITGKNGQFSTYGENFVVNDILIVSIGDSIASGEGNPEIPQSFNSYGIYTSVESEAQWAWNDPDGKRAHRSTKSNPAQAAMMLEESDPHTSVTFVSVAASGATIEKGLLREYEGIDRDGGFVSREEEKIIEDYFGRDVVDSYEMPSQIDQVDKIVGKRKIDALLISVGANDVGFSGIVTDLVTDEHPGIPYLLGENRSIDTFPPHVQANPAYWITDAASYTLEIEARMVELTADYDSLAKELERLNYSKVYITEYPDPTRNENGEFEKFFSLTLPGYSINIDEAKWASANVLTPLNSRVAQAADKHGWEFIGGIAAAFREGHGYPAAEDQRWIRTVAESRLMQGPFTTTILVKLISSFHTKLSF